MPPKLHDTLEHVDAVLHNTEKTFDPIRQSVFRRFPGIFTLLVTFGVAATFFGIERLLTLTPLFNEHPWLAVGVGVIILMVTGKLYAKLG